jgi:type IV pilus assembly protein PilW
MRKVQRYREAGVSLLELLVSMAIGLVILAAIGTVYQTSTSIQRQREDYSEVNDPIKMVSSILRTNISQAGYVDFMDAPGGKPNAGTIFNNEDPKYQNAFVRNASVSTPTPPLQQLVAGLLPIFGCDGGMNSDPNTISNTAPPVSLSCSPATSSTQHTLQIAYQAVASSTNSGASNSLTASNSTTGEGRDCLQQSIPASVTSGVVINRFFVQQNPNDKTNELYCQGSGNTVAQPIARGVEEFVVRYQLAQGGDSNIISAGGSKSQYLLAAQVSADPVGWPGVSAVEICMMTATPQIKGSAASGTAALQPTRPTCTRNADGSFNANIARAAGDTRLWKRFTYTVAVKNALYAFPL